MIIFVPVCGDEPSESVGCWTLLFSTRVFNLTVCILSLPQQLLGMADRANSSQVGFGFLWGWMYAQTEDQLLSHRRCLLLR